MKYVMGCGCLTEELSDAILIFELKEQVEELFYSKIRTCLGSERIGNLWRICAEEVVRDVGKKIDIKTKLKKSISLIDGVNVELDQETKNIVLETYGKIIERILPLFDKKTQTKILEEYNKIKIEKNK